MLREKRKRRWKEKKNGTMEGVEDVQWEERNGAKREEEKGVRKK